MWKKKELCSAILRHRSKTSLFPSTTCRLISSASTSSSRISSFLNKYSFIKQQQHNNFLENPLKFSRKTFTSETSRTNSICWNCNTQSQQSPFLVCNSCRSIQPVAHSVDYFQIFGLEKMYKINEDENLEKKYKDWQKVLHPDLVHSKSQKEREFAAEQSARVTNAYRTLINPRLRAIYILKLNGLDVNEEETISEPQLLAEIMEIRGAVEDAPDSKALMEIRNQDLQNICKILSSSKDWSIMQEALEKSTVQFTPGLVVDILHNCGIHGNAALNFFSWVRTQPGYHHTTETYNLAMKISGRGKDFKHMRNLFYEMRRTGCSITTDTWTIMIMQYGRIGLTEIALKNFNDMKDNGCTPSESTYKYLLISLCGKKGRKVNDAISIFHKMIRVGHVPDREVVESYLSCLCEANKLSEAKKSTDSLCKIGYTMPFGYSLLIRALCRSGKLEEALSLLDEVGAERSTLDQYTFGTLVHGLLQKGREKEALAKIDSMKQAGTNPTVHVYTSLIVHFFKEKRTEKALKSFEQMRKEGCEPTIVTYSALIRGYMNTERFDDAWNVFNHMKLQGPKPDFKTYSMFIHCLCKAGKSEEAIRVLSEMLDNGIVPSNINFRTVFFGLNREGKNDLAKTILQQKSALRSNRKFLT